MAYENTKRDAVAGLFDTELSDIRDRQEQINVEAAALEAEATSLDREATRLEALGAKVAEAMVVKRTGKGGE